MFIEKTLRRLLRFNLNDPIDLAEYNRFLQHPSTKIIERQILEQKDSHFEQDFNTTTTSHVCYLEVEECTF